MSEPSQTERQSRDPAADPPGPCHRPNMALLTDPVVERAVSPVWTTIVSAIGGYSVAALSIFLGYKLLLAGTTGQFGFEATFFGGTFGLKSVAPGIGFALFGMVIAIHTTQHLISGITRRRSFPGGGQG
jgi:hypothetical protein